MNAALAALNTLKPSDITIVKSMKNPPSAIKLVLESVCVIRSIKPDRKLDPSEFIFRFVRPQYSIAPEIKFFGVNKIVRYYKIHPFPFSVFYLLLANNAELKQSRQGD